MLDRAVLRRLHRLTEHEALTLTMYVATDQNRPSHRRRGYVVQAEAMLKELRGSHSNNGDLAAACETALDLVDQLEPSGRTALVVVHPEAEVAEVHTIKVDIAPSVHWRRGAFLRPVVEALDEHERFAVVLTGKKRARIFTVYLGEIVEQTDLLSETGTKTRTTGTDQWWSQARFQRHHEREVALHAKRVVDALFDLSLRMPFDRLIVAGPTEAAGQVARLLPRRVHGKLVKTINMAVTATPQEVLERVLEVQEEMEREQEQELVAGLVSELHGGGKAVTGLDAVVGALAQGRVWKLFYARGAEAWGWECRGCGAFSVAHRDDCPMCGEPLERVERFVDRVSQAVIDMGGQVEMVDGPAADSLREFDSIAALLRY